MRNTIFFSLLLSLMVSQASADIFPKLAVYGTSPTFSKHTAKTRLPRFDLVVLDFENWTNNPESIQAIREVNSETKILVYVNPMETFSVKYSKRDNSWELARMLQEHRFMRWWLWKTKLEETEDGYTRVILDHSIFFPQWKMLMMNMTTDCPEVDGQRWNQFIANFHLKRALELDPKPDGLFQDNSTADIYWLNNFRNNPEKTGWIDSNIDLEPDAQDELDKAWKAGQMEYVEIIRKATPEGFLVVGNKGRAEYPEGVYDGKMFEEFPFDYAGPDKRASGWYQLMENAKQTGPYSIFHSAWPTTAKKFKFVLASSMLAGTYFAVGHNNTKWFPEYRKVGEPLGEYFEVVEEKNSTYYYQREFEGATVKVWPEEKKGEIIYKGDEIHVKNKQKK